MAIAGRPRGRMRKTMPQAATRTIVRSWLDMTIFLSLRYKCRMKSTNKPPHRTSASSAATIKNIYSAVSTDPAPDPETLAAQPHGRVGRRLRP